MLNLSAGGGPTSGLQQYYQQQAALPVATAALNSVSIGGGVGGQCSQAQQQMALAALQQAAVAGASASASASATGASPQTQLLSMQLLQPSAAALFSPASLQGLQGLQNAQCLQGYQMLPASAQLGAAAQNHQQQQQFLAQLSLMQQLVYPSGLPQLQLSLPYPFHLPHLSQSTAALPFVAGPAFVPDLSPPSAAPHVLKVLVASISFHSILAFACALVRFSASRAELEQRLTFRVLLSLSTCSQTIMPSGVERSRYAQ